MTQKKLDDNQVRTIRKLLKDPRRHYTKKDLAIRYGVSDTIITQIGSNQIYTEVPDDSSLDRSNTV